MKKGLIGTVFVTAVVLAGGLWAAGQSDTPREDRGMPVTLRAWFNEEFDKAQQVTEIAGDPVGRFQGIPLQGGSFVILHTRSGFALVIDQEGNRSNVVHAQKEIVDQLGLDCLAECVRISREVSDSMTARARITSRLERFTIDRSLVLMQ